MLEPFSMSDGKTLAVIPARAGSKRLINKNILKLNDKPLIEWTLNAAVEANEIDEVFVSTDSLEIQEIVNGTGNFAPLLRPAHLASDTATSVDVVLHALEYFANLNKQFQHVILLQPTSPLRSNKHIDEAFGLYIKSGTTSLVSVCETEHSPLWCAELDEKGNLDFTVNASYLEKRSQDLPEFFRLNGAIYISSVNAFLKSKELFSDVTAPYIMQQKNSVDIDTQIDFLLAELLMKERCID